jgi:hypothetical protein
MNYGLLIYCPFFIDESRGSHGSPTISCESIAKNIDFKIIAQQLRFQSKTERQDFEELFCADLQYYKNCPYYKAIIRKYDEPMKARD